MAPLNQSMYSKDEKVLCFHHELLYEAKVLDSKHTDEKDKKSPMQYRVHYKGWKNTWDDWVPEDRLRKLNDENKELATNLRNLHMAQNRPPKPSVSAATKKKTAGSDLSSTRGSEERHASLPATGRGQKRGRDNDIEKEETFNLRPAIHINVPDHIKSILVDDWENVTKNLSLVPLPSKPSANEILTSYFDEEKNKRHLGSPEADLLEEVVAGLKEYFEKCVGRILLYRFERQQYLEVYNAVQAGTGEYEGKGMGDIYGAEHLSRLFVSLPELIAQTNMDQQSVNRLREELHKLTQWLGKNSTRFFKAPYEAASQEYIEKVRGV